MQSAAIILLSFFLLVVQSTFAHLVPWDMLVPSLSLPVVLFMGLHSYSATRGALISFAIGYLMDVFAGSPMGLHTLVTVAIFLISRVAALRLFLQGWIFEIILAFLLAFISSILILGIRALFDQDISGLLIHLEIVTSRAVATAIAAPVVFRLTAWVDRLTPRRRGGEGRVIHS
ncbi:MAG: rod shape-determining protein MreD [Proteobacteria bacterium]|nr:rod shape-determining protein MreD [Pseudomonadota bacterium]